VPTPKQIQNLRRGGDNGARARRARLEQRREGAEIDDLDPLAVQQRVLNDAAEGVLRLLESWLARGGDPPTVLIQAARECRHLAETVAEQRAEDEAQADADRVLARVDAALAGSELPEQHYDGGPEAILRALWRAVQRGATRCAKRLGKGEQPTRAALEALRELRMLASVVRRLDVTSSLASDDALDRRSPSSPSVWRALTSA
jgi:hypothetical protein